MSEAQGLSQGQDVSSSQPVTSSPPVQANESSSPASTSYDERTFRQDEVNDIVGRAKHEAVERYKRAQDQSISPAPSDERLRQLIADEAKRQIDSVRKEALSQSQSEAAQRTVNNFFTKIQAGKEKYQDFDKVTGDIDLAKFPNVVQLLAEYLDNSHDVFFDLAKDRIKLANLEFLAERSPNDAIRAARELAQSLKDNEQAAKIKVPNEPLSSLRPATAGTDSGAMTVSDYRKKYRI